MAPYASHDDDVSQFIDDSTSKVEGFVVHSQSPRLSPISESNKMHRTNSYLTRITCHDDEKKQRTTLPTTSTDDNHETCHKVFHQNNSCCSIDASSTMTNCNKRSATRVRFSTLAVREYEITLGDHPSCSCGPSVSLGWPYNQHSNIDIDSYERNVHSLRRSQKQLLMSQTYCEYLLEEFGYTRYQMEKEVSRKHLVQQQRHETVMEVRRIAMNGNSDSEDGSGDLIWSKELCSLLTVVLITHINAVFGFARDFFGPNEDLLDQ